MTAPRFIDTHCHLDFPPFIDSLPHTLAQASDAGVEALIIPAVTADRFSLISSLTVTYPPLYSAYGLHPIYIAQHVEEDLAELQKKIGRREAKCVAVGEIGLDLYMTDPQLEKQLWLLREQLALAKRYDLPVILHSRRSHDLLAKELKRAALPRTGVIHGFSGSTEQANAFVRLGYALGVGGVISYPRAQKTRRALAAIPMTSLLLETDAPDMPLMGYQGEANRPERVVAVFESLCTLRSNESPEQIAETLYHTTCSLFQLPKR